MRTHHRALRAMAAALPYRHAFSLDQPLTALDRAGPGLLVGSTHTLRELFEPPARALVPGVSMANVAAATEHAWFLDDRDHLPLVDHLTELAEQNIEFCGPCIQLAPSAPDQRAERAMSWRALSLYLPQDLLIAGLAASRGRLDPPSDRVELIDPLLARTLEAPVAETHLHLGAALEFGELWQAIMYSLACDPPRRGKFDDAGDGLGQQAAHEHMLCASALVRHMLFAFLWRRAEHQSVQAESFDAFLNDHAPVIAGRVGSGYDEGVVNQALDAALVALKLRPGNPAASEIPLARIRKAHKLLYGRTEHPSTIGGMLADDPLAQWLPSRVGLARPETRLLARGLAYLRHQGRNDHGFAQAFWQYVRVRSLVFGRLVQAPGTAGLDWFGRHYDRLSSYRMFLDSQTYATT